MLMVSPRTCRDRYAVVERGLGESLQLGFRKRSRKCRRFRDGQEAVRTLADSKLGVDLFRGSASLELYRGSSLQVAAQRLQKRFIYSLSKEKEYMAIYRASKP